MSEKIILHSLSYSDVLIIPQDSDISSRYGDEIRTSTLVARGMNTIELPIIASNMDTVTEHRMAIAMALHGGLGIIHRFMTPEDQAKQILLVKDKMRAVEDNPPTLPGSATIADAQRIQQQRNRGYIIVHEGPEFKGDFIGIATTRDVFGHPDTPISEIMTPRDRIVTVPVGTTLEDAVNIMRLNRIEKVPIVNSDGTLTGVYSLKDYHYASTYPRASLDSTGRLMVGGAIGVQKQDITRAHMLVEAGVDVLVLDIAHGHLNHTAKMLHELKSKEGISTPIIAGNVATSEGTLYIYDNGADGVKVGVGPGYVCETRDVAGTGVGQITAILEAREALARKTDQIGLIADGGIRQIGDFPKAIVAGADTIMIGSLFAGTEESPGQPLIINGSLHKVVRGMASKDAMNKRRSLGDSTTDPDKYAPEGRTTTTPFRGSVVPILTQFESGLRSGMSYVGAHTIYEMQTKGKFVTVTVSGANEQRRDLR